MVYKGDLFNGGGMVMLERYFNERRVFMLWTVKGRMVILRSVTNGGRKVMSEGQMWSV